MAVWSIVNLSALYGERRFDAECYRPVILRDENVLEPHNTVRLGDVATVTDGQHGYHQVDPASPIRHITAKCVLQGRVEGDGVDRLARRTHDANKRSQLAVDDILFSTAGRIGEAGLVCADILPANIDQDVARITLKGGVSVAPDFLTIFLNSEFGRFQCERATTGQIQRHISLAALREFRIPVVSWQHRVGQILRESITHAHKTKTLQLEAETILTTALGLDGADLSQRLFYENTFACAVEAGRLDAEHFQPKFETLLEILCSRDFELLPLGKMIKPVKNGFDCRDFCDDGTPYIRVADVKKGRLEIDGCARIPLKAKDVSKDISLAVGDVLFTRKGSFGNAAHVRPGQEHAIISSEIMLIRLKPSLIEKVLPEYLALYFNSNAGTLQAEKWAHGVAFFSISQEDLARFMVPILPMPEQKELKAKTDQAEAAYQQSRRLLDTAKRAVEIAIEEGEAAARKFLDGNGK